MLEPCRLYRACIGLELFKRSLATLLEHNIEHRRHRGDGSLSFDPWLVDCVQHSAVPLERGLIGLERFLNGRGHVDIHARWVLFRPGYLLAGAKPLIQPSANRLKFSRMAGSSKDRLIGSQPLGPNHHGHQTRRSLTGKITKLMPP